MVSGFSTGETIEYVITFGTGFGLAYITVPYLLKIPAFGPDMLQPMVNAFGGRMNYSIGMGVLTAAGNYVNNVKNDNQ